MLAKLVLSTLIVSVALSAPVRAAAVRPTTLYVRCGKLMSSTDQPLRGPLTMIVKGSTITAIAESLPMPEGAHELDLSRYTVVPGFIDSHVRWRHAMRMQRKRPVLSSNGSRTRAAGNALAAGPRKTRSGEYIEHRLERLR